MLVLSSPRQRRRMDSLLRVRLKSLEWSPRLKSLEWSPSLNTSLPRLWDDTPIHPTHLHHLHQHRHLHHSHPHRSNPMILHTHPLPLHSLVASHRPAGMSSSLFMSALLGILKHCCGVSRPRLHGGEGVPARCRLNAVRKQLLRVPLEPSAGVLH
jgi:hypothetical protein